VFEAAISHLEITTRGSAYNPVLLRALDAVRGRKSLVTA
jgi:hypothetical protein